MEVGGRESFNRKRSKGRNGGRGVQKKKRYVDVGRPSCKSMGPSEEGRCLEVEGEPVLAFPVPSSVDPFVLRTLGDGRGQGKEGRVVAVEGGEGDNL